MLIRREFSLDHCKGGITLIATNDFLLRGGLPFPQRMIQASNGIHDMSPSQADPQGRRLAIQQIPTISERGSTYVWHCMGSRKPLPSLLHRDLQSKVLGRRHDTSLNPERPEEEGKHHRKPPSFFPRVSRVSSSSYPVATGSRAERRSC